MAIININPEFYEFYDIIIKSIDWEGKAEEFIQRYNYHSTPFSKVKISAFVSYDSFQIASMIQIDAVSFYT